MAKSQKPPATVCPHHWTARPTPTRRATRSAPRLEALVASRRGVQRPPLAAVQHHRPRAVAPHSRLHLRAKLRVDLGPVEDAKGGVADAAGDLPGRPARAGDGQRHAVVARWLWGRRDAVRVRCGSPRRLQQPDQPKTQRSMQQPDHLSPPRLALGQR